MENLVNWDEIEEDLNERAINPDYKAPKINSRLLWKTVGLFALILTIGYLVNTIRYTGTGDARSWTPPWSDTPSGWNFDYNLFLLLILGSVPSLIVVGLKIEAGQSRALQRKKLLDRVNAQVNDINDKLEMKTMEVSMLKRMLDDACITYDSNLKALEKAREKKVEVLYKKEEKPCQPQVQSPQPETQPKAA